MAVKLKAVGMDASISVKLKLRKIFRLYFKYNFTNY